VAAVTDLVPAVDRAARMLEHFRDAEDEWGVSELARALDIPKSSAFQIAATLTYHGLLSRDPQSKRYRLGGRLEELALRTAGRPDLPALARPWLRTLSSSSGKTALLGRYDGGEVVLLAKAESPEPLGVSAPVGQRLDASAGVFGKVLHAAMNGPELDASLDDRPVRAFTPRTVLDSEEYHQELERVRERGWATDREEYLEGINAVGAPVRGAGGRTHAAICLAGLAPGFDDEAMRRAGLAVRDAAAEVSAALGGPAPLARPGSGQVEEAS